MVWITSDGADLWIIGTHGDPPPIDPSRLPAFETYFTDADNPGAPPAVTGLAGSAGLTSLTLSWDLPAEALWRTWEVYEGTATGFALGTPILVTTGTVVTLAKDPGSGPWFYKVRAINSRSEASAAVEVGPFTLSALPAVELGPGSVYAANMAAGAVDLASAVVAGQLAAAKIADNAITVDKLADTINTAISTAQATADGADGKAVAADAKAVAAAADAATAQAAAGTAATAASSADAKAVAASGLAATKAVVLYQTAAPGSTYQNAGTLWIDTTGSANTPKKWSGSAWVAITDKAATDAAAAAAAANTAAGTAQAAANAAQAAADAAASAAATADGKAVTAQTTANGKNKIIFSTAVASGTAYATGDIWFQKSGALIIAQWEFVAGAWASRTLDNAVIGNLDAGKISAGSIAAARIAAGTITGAMIAADTIVAGNIAAGAITATELGALAVTAGKIAAGAITATEIAASTITGAKIAAGTIAAANIVAGTLTATELAAGAVTTAKIAAGAVTAIEIGAGAVVAGKIAAGSIAADRIAAGAITATQIAAGTITAAKLNVADVQAGIVTAAAVNALTINAVTITGGNISGTTITGVTIRSIATQTKVTLGEGGCAINIYEGANVNPGQITLLSGMLGMSSRDNGYGVAAIFIAPNTASSYGDITLSGDCIVIGAFEAYGAGRIDGNLRIDGNVQPYGKVNPQTDFPGTPTGWTSDDGIWIQDNNPGTPGRRWKMTYNSSTRVLSLSYSTLRHTGPVFTSV